LKATSELPPLPPNPPKPPKPPRRGKKARGSPPNYLVQALDDVQLHQAHAAKVIASGKQNQKAVDTLVKKKDDQVAARTFRSNMYMAILAVAGVVGGLDHNIAGAAAAAIFAAILRGDAAGRTYLWHKTKEKIRSRLAQASERLSEWPKYLQHLDEMRERLERSKSDHEK